MGSLCLQLSLTQPNIRIKIFDLAYLGEYYGGFVNLVPRVLFVADLFVHVVENLEVSCLFLLIQ